MARFLFAGGFYAIAALFIFMGLDLAPDMLWPETSLEYTAASALVLGMISKCVGHVVLLHDL